MAQWLLERVGRFESIPWIRSFFSLEEKLYALASDGDELSGSVVALPTNKKIAQVASWEKGHAVLGNAAFIGVDDHSFLRLNATGEATEVSLRRPFEQFGTDGTFIYAQIASDGLLRFLPDFSMQMEDYRETTIMDMVQGAECLFFQVADEYIGRLRHGFQDHYDFPRIDDKKILPEELLCLEMAVGQLFPGFVTDGKTPYACDCVGNFYSPSRDTRKVGMRYVPLFVPTGDRVGLEIAGIDTYAPGNGAIAHGEGLAVAQVSDSEIVLLGEGVQLARQQLEANISGLGYANGEFLVATTTGDVQRYSARRIEENVTPARSKRALESGK